VVGQLNKNYRAFNSAEFLIALIFIFIKIFNKIKQELFSFKEKPT
jgi:hypothetical protein